MISNSEILKKIEKHFQWLTINGKHILAIDLKGTTEEEFIACTQYMRTVTFQSPYDEIRAVIDLTGIKFTPRMVYYAMQVAKYGSKKVTHKAGIGMGPVVLALYRISRMQGNSTRLFNTYEEALKFVSE